MVSSQEACCKRMVGQRLAAQIAMDAVALQFRQEVALLFGLNPFGNDFEPQLMRLWNDARHNGCAVHILRRVTGEGPVDLQHIQPKTLGVGK